MGQTRVMAGQGIPFRHVVLDAWRIYRKHRRYTGREVSRYWQRYLALTELLQSRTGRRLKDARVLELGCGQRAALPLLFAAQGAEAEGVDVEAPTYQMDLGMFRRVWRTNGAERAMKSVIRNILFDRRFFRELGRVSGARLAPFPPIRIHVGDAAGLSLPANSYHLVFSFEVMEHVADVEMVVRNLNEWLHPDGVAYVLIHLFPSLSGGHCMDWHLALELDPTGCRPPPSVPPWDHLLESRYPANLYLNRMRIDEYRSAFRRHMTVVDEQTTCEGQHLLHLAPPELLREYSREELTTSNLVLILRKKSRPSGGSRGPVVPGAL